MTQRQQLIDLLADFGITPHVNAHTSNDVTLAAGEGNVEGYGQFYAVFEFDADGNFVKVGVWE